MKIKTKLRKRWAAFKEYVRAQKFYAKRAIQNSLEVIKNFLLVSLIVVGTSTAAFFTSISGDILHQKYIEKKVGDNVFLVQSMPDSENTGRGTAFAVKAPSGKTYLLTNEHVCGLANKNGIINVFEKHSGRMIPRRVLEKYSENDLCLVEGVEGYQGLSFGKEAEVGDVLWTVGHPLGGSMSVAKGRVKDFNNIKTADDTPISECKGPRLSIDKIFVLFFFVDQCMLDHRSMNLDAPTYPGNSGSPVVNAWGNVVGIIFAANSFTHWGSAVPLKDIKAFLKAY